MPHPAPTLFALTTPNIPPPGSSDHLMDSQDKRECAMDLDQALLSGDPALAVQFVQSWGEALRHYLLLKARQ